jgi:hypothetical protein
MISEVWQTTLTSMGGSAVVACALVAWLGSVWKDRIAGDEAEIREKRLAEVVADVERKSTEQMARLSAGLEHVTLVDRIRFEHEYEVYKQAWARLIPLRHAVLSIRPILDHIDPSESNEDRLRRRLAAVTEPYNAFWEVVEANKPFFDLAVYLAFKEICTACHAEYVAAEYADTEDNLRKRWDRKMSNDKAIIEAIEAACTAIQTRIAAVRVV